MNLRGKLYALMVHHGYKLTHEEKEYRAYPEYELLLVKDKTRWPQKEKRRRLDHNQLRDIIDSYINKITSYGQLQKIEDIHMAYEKVAKECRECRECVQV